MTMEDNDDPIGTGDPSATMEVGMDTLETKESKREQLLGNNERESLALNKREPREGEANELPGAFESSETFNLPQEASFKLSGPPESGNPAQTNQERPSGAGEHEHETETIFLQKKHKDPSKSDSNCSSGPEEKK